METARKRWTFKMTPWRGVFLLIALLALAIILVRLVLGLGATTNLNDQWPWGFWISFDVLLGVALAGGGYGIALIVYVLRRDKFYPIARSAMLTSLLGYVIVVLGLLIEVGQWFNFYKPFISWGHHSVLFEVFWCISMYTLIQVLEFGEIATEKVFKGAHKFLKLIMPVLLVIGITLPTLHQSSLGGLYYEMIGKLDPLWWSPLLPPFFLVSSFFVGPAMIVIETALAQKATNHEAPVPVLKGLVKISAVAMLIYFLAKIGDLYVAGEIGNAFAGTFASNMFLLELGVGCVVPLLLFFGGLCAKRGGLILYGVCTVAGVVMNRFNVVLTGMSDYLNRGGGGYFPAWTEFAVSAGLVCIAFLVYLFVADNFNITGKHEQEEASFARDGKFITD
ncbi:MAG: Ni/Fe-hydrogenase cytochrome b subunit [Gracilibacteraceae bacterium]|jgi:Ni/Fe-hydrogenase subunit HybB-like protein|nr:Ni/Fe-hydrogenase cytochrome b subunit [Gracilibacteraceae bacterium]